jgi:23S rRNA pseudouridine1911/1915/1917 synthase
MKHYQKKPAPPRSTRLRVTSESELMAFLQAKMGGMSRTGVKSLLSHRQVMVNGKITTLFNHPLKPGDEIEVKSSGGNLELKHPKLKIIFEDKDLIVVEKKEGLLTVITQHEDETTAFSILKSYVQKSASTNRIYVVHRLDRETSGVLVFAKSRDIQLRLQENWHRVVTSRIYNAVVEGKVEKQKDTIVSWLSEHEKSLKIHSSNRDDGGQKAVTHYRCLKSNEQFSLLELELETGRKNQIRVHMESIGHPIVGDKKYGSDLNMMGRMALHARVLEFIHPVTLQKVRFETSIPPAFLKIFRG